MNRYQINAIITQALVDPDFQKAILNGQRRERLKEFSLSHEMVDAIMSIKGDNIHRFIYQLNSLGTSYPGKNIADAPRSYQFAS